MTKPDLHEVLSRAVAPDLVELELQSDLAFGVLWDVISESERYQQSDMDKAYIRDIYKVAWGEGLQYAIQILANRYNPIINAEQ